MYWHMWIVMYRKSGLESFKPWCGDWPDAVAHKTKKDAMPYLLEAQQYHGKLNAYIQKVGAIK